MKKILVLLAFVLSLTSFSNEEVEITPIPANIAPVIENISISDVGNEDFIISVLGSLEADPEIMEKMSVIGEAVDNEVLKSSPDWVKVEQLYNELSVYTNKVSVNMM
ncbi:MAG: hypothetical protein ACRCZ0_00810, partial [Cetobacterium sp.]